MNEENFKQNLIYLFFHQIFPSLKGKSCEPLRFRKFKYSEDDDLCEAGILDCQKDASLHTRETEEFKVFSMEDIHKHCLDKQKVREVLDAFNMKEHHPRIYKELGL